MSLTPPVTLTSFAKALLQSLGMPVTPNNIQALVAAQAIEGGFMNNHAAYNPLNTTQSMPGSHAATDIGVQSYTSWDQGLAAITKTLKNGLYNDILGMLQKSAAPDDTLHVWQQNPNYGWYHCELPSNPGTAVDCRTFGIVKVPNPIGSAASYQSQANNVYPTSAGSYPIGQPHGAVSPGGAAVRLGLLAGIGYALWRALPLIFK